MIYIPSKALGTMQLPKEELKKDKMESVSYGDCALGKKAVYLSACGLSRITYLPLESITRVFKRLAVTKGFFEQDKIYGTLSYLVLQYEGREKQIRFTHEEDVNAILEAFAKETEIPYGKPAKA